MTNGFDASFLTGARTAIVADLGERLAALRRVTALPIAAGFGVSSETDRGK